jgi:osmotically inducible protein OsmC
MLLSPTVQYLQEKNMIKRTGSAVWSGGLKDGKGSISTQSGVMDNVQYGFNTRFENGPGTNPEELIGAAHAGCFTMALSAQLGEAGMTATSLKTTATVTLDKNDNGFAISAVHLNLVATIPGANQAAFEAAALKAKQECPVSKLFNAAITLDARLEG